MNLVKDEYIKNIILGIYEVLDIAGYDLKDADEIVGKIKGLLDGYKFLEDNLTSSHYAYVVLFLKQIDEWGKVEGNLNNTIREVLKTVGLDNKET